MMHTDEYRNSEYFRTYIEEQVDRINMFKQLFDECEETEKERVSLYLSSFFKDLIAAEFSNNNNLPSIISTFNEYAGYIKLVGFSSYSEYIDFLSLQIVLGVNDIKIDAPTEFDDGLSCLLRNYIHDVSKPIGENLVFPEYYKVFFEYGKGNLTFDKLIEYVSNEWYKSSEDFYWYDSHLNEENVYTGYWCYIASALLRIRGDFEQVVDDERYIV